MSYLSRRLTSHKRSEIVELVALRYIKITTALESTRTKLYVAAIANVTSIYEFNLDLNSGSSLRRVDLRFSLTGFDDDVVFGEVDE